ncbi:20980_t:CDS:2, partial [Gigaspora rosea]
IEKEIYYNSWESEINLAICLVETMERIINNYNIGHEITTQQKKEAYDLLLDNHDVFATDISESGQTMRLGCTTTYNYSMGHGQVQADKRECYWSNSEEEKTNSNSKINTMLYECKQRSNYKELVNELW